jgi:hypothetical protein
MPELSFEVTGVEVMQYAAAPTLAFKLKVLSQPDSASDSEPIHSVALRCQIRIEPARRQYSPAEKERLFELFGEPHRWGQTVKSTLWTNTSLVVPSFVGSTIVDLPVACTFDFNVATTKYFDALEEGLVALCFLFSGSVFYAAADGGLQVAQISWEQEANFKMPIAVWKQMMEQYYPNTAWLCLRKDVFDRLMRFKIEHAIPNWEQALERLLSEQGDEVTR